MVTIVLCNAGDPGLVLVGELVFPNSCHGALSLQTTTRESVCHKERAAVPQLDPMQPNK